MSKKYIPTVGLEIHAELKTQTKMFCNSKNDPDEKRPNVNICPVCMGHPGTLPVINKQAVKHILKMGIAVGGKIADFTEFDRKNYFYPDIPKGYQISQYKYPLISGGELAGVALTRIHLEEDTARSSHEEGKNHSGGDFSLVDFNRAGLPLMELVTEPVIHDAKQAGDFARELQLLLQYLGAGEANMEKGEMRVEANISVATEEDTAAKRFGTKVEVKNLNSFRSVERAIAYEVDRHIRILEAAEESSDGSTDTAGTSPADAKVTKIVQETRGWDETKQATFSQRAKEDSHDYRYFPDPDLPKLYISEIAEFSHEALKAEMPELPSERRMRLVRDFELKTEDAEVFIYNQPAGAFFEDVVSHLFKSKSSESKIDKAEKITKNEAGKKLIKLAANYIISDYLGLLKNESRQDGQEYLGKISGEHFAELVSMIGEGKLGSRAAKDILMIMHTEGGRASEIAAARGLLQKSDEGELKRIMSEVVAANPKVVADYKAGKVAALQSLIGQGMKATKGSANPELLRKIASDLLG